MKQETHSTQMLDLLSLGLGSSIKEIVISKGNKMHMQKTAANMRRHN